MDVPKDRAKNRDWRLGLLKACAKDPKLRAGVKERCARDILFWTNFALWTYDPRRIKAGENPDIPFITWPFQDDTLKALDKHLGLRDIGIEKSRDMGASWMCLVAFLHEWQFKPGRTFMVVSRNERLVDAPSDPDSLFWKLRYLLKHQPPFLLPKFTCTKLHLENEDNGSTIDGASTTADAGRGGRRTAFLVDEFAAFEPADGYAVNAATANNTDCRIFNSTYKGAAGCFYDQLQRTDPDFVRISLLWTKHPGHAKDAVQTPEGKWVSPWYRKKCNQLVIPALIAAELDMNPSGAASSFFPTDLLEKLLTTQCRPPLWRGRLDGKDPKKPEFVQDAAGPLELWLNLDLEGKVPSGEQFVIGTDISAGTGATNSVLSIADRKTREKVGELAISTLSPDRFADLAVAVGWFFREAHLIWEMNGPGTTFGKRIVDLGYRNIYYKRDVMGLTHKLAKGIVPGWHSGRESKELLLRSYVTALAEQNFVNRSTEALKECRQYIYVNGEIANNKARTATDPSGAKQNHGDRVIADALANWGLGEPEESFEKPDEDPYKLPYNPDPNSFAWRFREWQEEQKQTASGGWASPKEALSGWNSPQMEGW